MTLLSVGLVSPGLAHPPATPAHGLNASTYWTLWSGDIDHVNVSANESASATKLLSEATDIPLDRPPAAVEQWNRGDLADFPNTSTDRSYYPPDAKRTQGRFVKDAYIALFAIEPSTRVLVSPTDQPFYIGPAGQALATVDFRVDRPHPTFGSNRTVSWRVRSARITETRLLVDGQLESRGGRTHTPTFAFSDLDRQPGREHTLTVEADIAVSLRRTIRVRNETCTNVSFVNATRCTTRWTVSVDPVGATVTVSDSIDVTVYDLEVSGVWTRYPDGDLGVVAFKNEPWLGYSLADGDVRGVWRFYSARDQAWDTLVNASARETTTEHSPLHPLQVYAYPFEPGPTAGPASAVTIVDTLGTTTEPPTLPPHVDLDVVPGSYVASYGLATRFHMPNASIDDISAFGLVRGSQVSGNDRRFAEIALNRSVLTLSVVNRTAENVTLEVDLLDASSGAPIDTSRRLGAIEVAGERVNTSANGTVRVTVPRSAGAVTARYDPAPWWDNPQSYLASSDVVYVGGGVIAVLETLYRLGVPVGLFLFGVFLIDRITGWDVWPPWRGL